MTVRIQREDFNIGAEIAQLTRARADIGAVATFTGICRDDGIKAMTLEHYPGMAEAEIERHVEEAQARWRSVTLDHAKAPDHPRAYACTCAREEKWRKNACYQIY